MKKDECVWSSTKDDEKSYEIVSEHQNVKIMQHLSEDGEISRKFIIPVGDITKKKWYQFWKKDKCACQIETEKRIQEAKEYASKFKDDK